MKQTINKRLTLWLLTLALAVVALPALTAPAQAAEKTPVDVVFGSETVKGEKEKPYGTTFVYCENVSYSLENPDSNDPYYAAYTTWATGDIRIADTVDGKEVRKIRSGFAKGLTGNVTLGKNINSLDYSVFSGGKLREVTIPEGSNLKRICQYAFRACPNLVRVGVGNTDKLPASVTDIDYYAFYESPAIQSIDLTQTKVKSIDDCTFTDCTALASVKLPNDLTSIGHSAFKGCTALKALDVPASVKSIGMDTFSYSGIMDLKLRCGAVSASGMAIARSLMAMPDGAKVYLPKPSSEKYKDTMQFIYGNGRYTYCGANAKVKVYWMDNNNNTTAPVTEPSARSNSVVTLSGKDKDNNPVSFNYDYTDADKDGLGAVIHLNGRQKDATLKLTLNGSGTTNDTTAVIFTRVRAYDYRHQGNIDSKAFSGKELTELLLRQQAVNYNSSASSSMSQEQKLALSSSDDKLGLYYFIPTLVNKGSASQPMNAKTLPPVLVVYTPTDGTDEGVGLETNFGSSNKWFCGNGDKVDFNETGLSRAYPLYADGFEACFGTESGALTKGKAAYFNGGQNSITYQWKRVNKDGTSVLQTISASNYDYSKAGEKVANDTAAATFNCYENVLPRGLQYCIGGLSGSYLKSLYSSGVGTYYFQPTITVKVNGTVSKSVTGPIQSITFYDELTRLDNRMEVVSTDSGTGNVTGPVQATGAPYKDIRQYTIKKGTINAYADIDSFTNLWGLKNKDYDGTIVYDWYYENRTTSAKVYFKDAGPNLPLDQLAKATPGPYTVFCNVSVRNSKGETVLKSNSGTSGFYCWVDVTSAAADYPADLPSFENFPKALYFTCYQSGSSVAIPAPGRNMYKPSTFYYATMKLELYKVNSKNENRGGSRIFVGAVNGPQNGDNGTVFLASTNSVHLGTFPIFQDYKACWCYYKYTLESRDRTKTYVVYSPTFALQPASSSPQQIVADGKTPLSSNVKVTGQPYSEYWLPNSGQVTLTAELETKNYPLVYGISGGASVFKWHSVDAGKTLTANDNFTQSVRIDSADIDADGNLLLKGALTATFKRQSGNGNDYFDTTLPLTGNPTVSADNRKFDLRSPSDLASLTTQVERIDDVTIHPTTVSVAAPTASVTGGRLVPVWNGDTGKYEWGEAPTGEFAENEYRLFSERFDGKAAGDYSNIPASPEPVKITAATKTSGATIRWRVTVSDGTGKVLSTTDLMPSTPDVTYDSAPESNGYAAYEDKAAAAWTNSNSTLTVAIPTGAKAMKLTVQPMAVKTNGNQITGLAYGEVYEVYTNRAAKATTPTISNVYSSAPTYKISRDQLAAAEPTFEFASPNIWVGTGGRGDTTYRWYLSRVKDERSVDIGTAIPLSEEKTVSGGERDYSVLPLTAELLRQHCAKPSGSFNDTLYIYAYAQNYDPSATQVQYAEKLMKVCAVEVADYYAMPPVSITTAYKGTDTVDLYYGQKAPEEMFSITIPLPADKTRYSVRLRGEAKSPDGTFVDDQSTSSAAILRDDSPAAGTTYSDYQKRENYYVYIPTYYSSGVPHMTVTIDEGTATFTVDQGYFPKLDLTSIYVSGSGSYESADMDFEFYWSVKGSYFGPKESATGGDRTETTGRKYTVRRRQYPLSAPTLSFYTGTEANYSGTTKPIPGAENTAFWGGETPAATLPGFRQHSSGYSDIEGLRPVTVTVGSSAATWVLVRMEYWNETNKRWEKLVNSSIVSATGETREYEDGGTTYTLVKPGSTVEMLTGPGVHFGAGSAPRFLRIVAYPLGENAFAITTGALTGYGPIAPAKQIFVVQPLTGEVVNAAKPACSDDSSFENFTFIARDSSMTEHTFGANGLWSVKDGGKLSYQWMFYDRTTGEYENIAGETNPTLTVTNKQVKAWCENNGDNYTNLRLVVTNTNTDPKITGNRYVTEECYPTVYYQDNAVTPRVSITSSGSKTDFTLGEQGGTLTGTVSNLAELNNPSYAWGCRVTKAVRNDDAKYTAPADTAFYSLSKDDVAGADTNTLKLYAINGGNDYNIDGSWFSMSSGSKCLWDSYKEVTIEYRLTVREEYTSGTNTTSVEGNSNTIAVTIKRPVQVYALSVTQNGTDADPSHCILRDDQPLTFTAPAVTGSTPRSYKWARSWEAAAGSNNYNVLSDQTEPTFVLTKDDYLEYNPYILCVMTDTYTDPNSNKTLELKTVSDRILVHYIGENAGKPLFTAGNQVVVADPGATGESFDGTATSPDFGTITYKWEMVDRVTGLKTPLPDTTAELNLDPYTAKIGAWYFTCTATNTRDGKSASDSRSYELYIRGVTLTAELPAVDAVAGESSEVKLTATAFGLHGGNFAWTNTGATEWTLKDVKDGNWYSNFVTLTATAVAAPTASSSGALNTTVTFSGTSWDGSAVKTAAVDLKANVKDFMVAGDPIELTVDTAVPAGTKLTHKGAAPEKWTVVDDDGLTAAGVTVDANGTLSGTPTVPGPYRMTVKATKGTTTATSIVTVYVKIPEREGLGEYGTLTVGENTSLDVRENHSGSGWNWDACTGVLTLDNYNGGRLYASGFGTAPLYIRLRGSSTVTASNQIAIYGASDKGTVLCGDGNLTVNGTGDVVENALDVRGSGKITLNGTGAYQNVVDGSLTVGEQGDVEISGSGVECKGINGALTVNGGKLNITVTGKNSRGIVADYKSITIPAGTVTVTAKGAGSRGMDAAQCSNNFQVSGGTLTVDVEGDSSYNSTAYAVWAPHTTIRVSGGGTFDITGKQVNRGIYWARLDVDGGTLNINLTRTGDDESVYGVEYYNTTHSVKNNGKLNINIEADAGSYVVGIKDKALEVDETSAATITVKSNGDVCAAVLERLKCDGTINLTAESGKETATAGDGSNLAVEGKGTLTATAKGSEYAQPFGEVTLNGTDGAKPLTVNTHATVTAKSGTAYLNNSTVKTQGNVNITMEVASVPGAEARGLRASLNVGHTAGFITLRTVPGTTLANALAGSVNYDPANFAVTGNPKGKDFVTYTAISQDALLISNTSGGAVTLYQNTELSTDELTFTASGGAAPYTWALTGTLPAGMSLSAAEGKQVKITGKPTAAGSSTFTLTATDGNGKMASAAVTITVKAADLVFAEYSTSGIFRDNTLYLPLSSDWATNKHGDEKLNIKSVSGDINKKLTSAKSTGVLKSVAIYSDYINHWISETDPSPKVGDKGTITVTLRKDMDTVIATYTYNYEFVKDNPRYLTVGSEQFPAMLENASGTGSKGSWSWDCASSTLTLDNYKCQSEFYPVRADREFPGLTVQYKGNVELTGIQFFSGERLPGLTYKALNDSAALTMSQRMLSGTSTNCVAADVTFEGGNVTLYPLYRPVGSGGTAKITVKDVKQFLLSGSQLYSGVLGSDAVVLQYATDYWLHRNDDHEDNYKKMLCCGTAVPTLEGVEIQGPSTVSQSGSIALTAQVFPTWLPDAKKYSSANAEQGAAFTFAYTWNPAIGASAGTTVSASGLFGTTPAVGAVKTVNCTAQLKFNGSYSTAVTSADHTITAVADGVKVSGRVTSYNGRNGFTVTLYEAGTKTVKHTATISGTGTSGQVTQDFNLDTVAAGEYDLVVTKPGHLTYTVKKVKVEGTDLDLTKRTDEPYSTITMLAGDVNEDGKINSTDTTFIRYPSNFNKSVTSPGVDAIADINGDGKINSTDTTIVRYPENFNKNAGTHCTVQY